MPVNPSGSQEVGASNHRGDALMSVVDDDGEVIRGQAVAAIDEVIAFGCREIDLDRALEAVVEAHDLLVDPHANGRRPFMTHASAASAGVAPRADVVSARRVGNLRSRQGGGALDVFTAATATKRVPSIHEIVCDVAVDGRPRALVEHVCIPLKAVRLERAQDIVGGPALFARRIDVLDSDEPSPAALLGMQVARGRGGQRAEMQRTGGRGRKAAYIARVLTLGQR